LTALSSSSDVPGVGAGVSTGVSIVMIGYSSTFIAVIVLLSVASSRQWFSAMTVARRAGLA
ncbi:MAG: hypothetical protein ACRD0P_35775, partial [Stackebrandtia sp.]